MWVSAARVRSSGVSASTFGHERREVVVGQVVERDLGDGATDLLGGLEPARVPARQRGATQLQFLCRHRPFAAYGAQLAERLAHGIGGGVRLHARGQGERAAPAPELETGARAVGVALALAQVRVDAADELSAEDEVERHERVVVASSFGPPPHGRCAVPTAARRPAALTSSSADPRRDRQRRGIGVTAPAGLDLPAPECRVDGIAERLVRSVSHGDDRHARRIVHALMERPGLPGVHRAQRYFAADGQVTVGMRARRAAR